MSDLPANVLKTLEDIQTPKTKLRSIQEINARYKLSLQNYKNLCYMAGDVRDQKIAVHAEIKMLGWVLGLPDRDIVKDIAENSNRPTFPAQS